MKAILCAEISNKENFTENAFTQALLKDESIVIAIKQNRSQHKSQSIKLRYKITAGDCRRLNKDGVLKVYNMDQLVEIPVSRLLGKWKTTHIGITVFKTDDQWQVNQSQAECIINKKQSFIAIIKGLIIKLIPPQMLEKLLNGRLNENSLLN